MSTDLIIDDIRYNTMEFREQVMTAITGLYPVPGSIDKINLSPTLGMSANDRAVISIDTDYADIVCERLVAAGVTWAQKGNYIEISPTPETLEHDGAQPQPFAGARPVCRL